MLNLQQIEILNSNELIVEVLEPIVYKTIGTLIKSDDTLAKEKANVHYTVAVVVKVYEAPIVEIKKVHKLASDEPVNFEFVSIGEGTSEAVGTIVERVLKVGDNLIVPRAQITPIQFPIEGYDSPRLGVINTYTPFAIIKENL
jgi:hypothetical protein